MTDTYNGWTNWETWVTNLWLTNDPVLYEQAREVAQEGDDEVRELVENLIWGFGAYPAAGLATDFINVALGVVNWTEIREGLTEQ